MAKASKGASKGAGDALLMRIAAALDCEEKSHRDIPGASPLRGRRRSFWTGALSGIGATAAAAGLAFFMLAPPHADLPEQLASAHIRSLMPDHLIDVVSSDKHTVKPWFAGHADVSPAVADFESQGFRLVGGRADYFDHQRAAVLTKHAVFVPQAAQPLRIQPAVPLVFAGASRIGEQPVQQRQVLFGHWAQHHRSIHDR